MTGPYPSSNHLGPKTVALLAERDAPPRAGTVTPELGQDYHARTLPPGAVVTLAGGTEYVIGRSGLCMRWEQPVPGSADWTVTYAGRLPDGVWMTHRERAEVDAVAARPRRCSGDAECMAPAGNEHHAHYCPKYVMP
jgi:hypothetical protein